MNLFDNEKQQKHLNESCSNTTSSLKQLIQELLKKLKESYCLNQELSAQVQKLQEELQKTQTELCVVSKTNRELSIENDNLRNRGGWMLKEKQEKLEKENEAVRVQNSRLKSMVEMSRIEAYEGAIAERDAALELVDDEKKKVKAIQENTKIRIAIINKDTKKAVKELKEKIKFWQLISGGMLLMGMLIGVTF